METAKQMSVYLENKPGRLAQVLSELAREKINLSALSVMDSHDSRVLRFVVNEIAKTLQTLNRLGIRASQTDVLVVELRNQPGALAHVCEQLGGAHVNIDYAYCIAGGRNGKTVGIFKVSNAEKAMRVLSETINNRRLERRQLRDQRT